MSPFVDYSNKWSWTEKTRKDHDISGDLTTIPGDYFFFNGRLDLQGYTDWYIENPYHGLV